MRGRRTVPFLVLLAAAIGAPAAVGAAGTVDATYSCRVSPEPFIDVFASVTYTPANSRPQPGGLSLTTVFKSVTKNGATTTPAQIGLSVNKNSLKVDTSSCRRVKQTIPLSSKGLAGPPRTATPTFFGYFSVRCTTAARVLVRLRVTMTDRAPSQALLGIRNDNRAKRPIAFYRWSPSKLSAYLAGGCS